MKKIIDSIFVIVGIYINYNISLRDILFICIEIITKPFRKFACKMFVYRFYKLNIFLKDRK